MEDNQVVEVISHRRVKMLGKLPTEECNLSCSLSLSYLWALGLCLLSPAPWPCTGLTATQQRQIYTAMVIITEMKIFGLLVAPIELGPRRNASFLKENNIQQFWTPFAILEFLALGSVYWQVLKCETICNFLLCANAWPNTAESHNLTCSLKNATLFARYNANDAVFLVRP